MPTIHFPGALHPVPEPVPAPPDLASAWVSLAEVLQKKDDPSLGYVNHSLEGLDGAGSSSAMTRGTTAVQRIWATLQERPDLVLSSAISELRIRRGLSEDAGFTLADYNRDLMPKVGTFRSFKKFLTMIAHVWDLGYRENLQSTEGGCRVMAHLIQIYKVAEQAALSGGTWTDWPLLPYPDPEGVGRSLAAPAERAALAALAREEAALVAAGVVTAGGARKSPGPGKQESGKDPPAKKRQGKQPGKKKGGGKGKEPSPATEE